MKNGGLTLDNTLYTILYCSNWSINIVHLFFKELRGTEDFFLYSTTQESFFVTEHRPSSLFILLTVLVLYGYHPFPSPPPPKKTHKVFHSANVDTSASAPPVIAYCNGGVASTLVLFLLYQLHQREHSTTEKNNTSSNASDGDGDGEPWANYDGSWNEWGNDEEAPVER